MKKLHFIFVHGLSGWGSYDRQYQRMPYWGMRNGDLMEFLRARGFSCYAASVSGAGSAWDRACELYAQLYGTTVDYGARHTSLYGHDRFGRDFSADPLLPEEYRDDPIVLIGHSFGGATIRVFAELLAHGSAEEREFTPQEELSGFFTGGKGDRIFSLITLAAPTNGTTSYDMYEDPSFDPVQFRLSLSDNLAADLMSKHTGKKNPAPPEDQASYDMHIDNALALNNRLPVLEHVYYFSVACQSSLPAENNVHVPDRRKTEKMFIRSSYRMGAYTGYTKGGYHIDESWHANDGLVNVVSALAPFGQPQKNFDRKKIEKGIWNIMPVFPGDHMSLQGGMTKLCRIFDYYYDLVLMVSDLYRKESKTVD